ncbi:GNAT family N-acetyltransferase [Streptomyces sp. NPDC005551]|uniref:GNAT family N-acetyltransferase n=1 Tax=Streptomyces sp. NPDC005551 TaxID=3364725 RepID=UPI0036B9AB96
MTEVYLRRLSRWQAEQQRDGVADVHVAAYRGAAGAEYRDRQSFLREFEQHVRQRDFDMVVADTNGLVGCAYGHRIDRTGDWWSGFRGGLPPDIEELTASGRTFLLAELMVVPGLRRRGIATRLAERLLARLDTDLVVATVDRPDENGHANAAARTLHTWGWSRLGEVGPPAVPTAGIGAGSGPHGGGRPGSGVGPGHHQTVTREVWIRRPPR